MLKKLITAAYATASVSSSIENKKTAVYSSILAHMGTTVKPVQGHSYVVII